MNMQQNFTLMPCGGSVMRGTAFVDTATLMTREKELVDSLRQIERSRPRTFDNDQDTVHSIKNTLWQWITGLGSK